MMFKIHLFKQQSILIYHYNNKINMLSIYINFRDLKFLQERQNIKCKKLEQVCQEKEFLYSSKIQNLLEQNMVN